MNRQITRVLVAGLLLAVFVDVASTHGDEPHQPYASYWLINDLLKWDFATDPHAPFNVSRTPLAKRFVHAPTQRNPRLSTDPQIMSLVGAHPTSNHPSQGFREVTQYAFPFWQYIDVFVMWGGSASEGLVVTPSAPWIDAAHRNGVEVYGTIFMPPKQYGGEVEWVRELLAQEPDGKFPIADKLIEVATLYGFDGWFLNQETQGLAPADAKTMQQFLKYYQSRAADRLKMIWYDSMIDNGSIDWQEELNDRNAMFFQEGKQKISDMMFLDFGWTREKLRDTALRTQALGRSPWELFAGIDLQSHSYRTPVAWSTIYRDAKPSEISLALYWPNSTTRAAKSNSPTDVYAEEAKFWNGCQLEKPVQGSTYWKGFSNYFPARSAIQRLPFITRFNYGLGTFYNEQGKRLSDQHWHNLSSQDVLPTWQWDTNLNLLNPSFDFAESYNGGSCLRVDSTLAAEETAYLPLYKTQLTISPTTMARVVSKSETKDVVLSLTLTFVGQENKRVEIPLGNAASGEWSASSCDLKDYVGNVAASIGLTLRARKPVLNQPVFVGELAVTDGNLTPQERPKANARPYFNGDTAELYLQIAADAPQSVWYHDVYQLAPDGRRIWLGRASGEHYYIPKIHRPADLTFTQLEVKTVNKHGVESAPAILRVGWND